MSIIDKFLAILAPHECLGCRQEGSLLCSACLELLPPAPQGSQAFALYQGTAKDLIWRLKTSGAQAAATVMADCMKDLIRSNNALLVAVPTATSRVRQRGYDQSSLLVRELSKITGLPYLKCLVRSGQAHQVGSSRNKRLQQLEGALRVTKSRLIKDAHIILIDDVTTTGATFHKATEILIKAGARRVDALAFAYTPPSQNKNPS